MIWRTQLLSSEVNDIEVRLTILSTFVYLMSGVLVFFTFLFRYRWLYVSKIDRFNIYCHFQTMWWTVIFRDPKLPRATKTSKTEDWALPF